MAPLDLYNAANELLAAAAAALATTSSGAPKSQYVSAGPPVYDCCDLLTVHVAESNPLPMREAGNQQLPQMRPAVPMVGMVITALRCYPVVTGGIEVGVPNAADLDAASRTIYSDGWLLINYLRTLGRTDRLFAGRPCRALEITSMRPTPTQGGCAGWTLTVIVEIDGYAPV